MNKYACFQWMNDLQTDSSMVWLAQEFFRDSKRVLECLQKSLRIATSSIDELISVQLYCDALDQYLYYFERHVDSVKFLDLLHSLFTSQLKV